MKVSSEEIDITVMTTNDVTVAFASVETFGRVIDATGSAKRQAGDRHDAQVASMLATGRALKALGGRMEKQGLGRDRDLLNQREHAERIEAARAAEEAAKATAAKQRARKAARTRARNNKLKVTQAAEA